jgi:MFS family permease
VSIRAETNWQGVGFGLTLGVLAAYQQFKLPPTLPLLLNLYHYDRLLAGGFMSAFAIAGLVLSLKLGVLIQRHGAAAFLAAAFGLLLIGSLLTLALPEYGLLVLGARLTEGIGFAVLAIAGPVFSNLNAGTRQLSIVIGLQATWIPAGQLIANLAAQPVVALGMWRPLWWGGIVATALVAVWTLVLQRTGSVDLKARIRRAPEFEKAESGSAAPPAITRVERRALYLAAGLFVAYSGQYFAYMTWLPQFLVEVHGFSPSQAVLGYSVPIAVLLVFNVLTGLVVKRRQLVAPVLGVTFVSQALIWLLLPVTGGGVAGAVSLVVYGVGSGIIPTCLFALPSVILGPGRAGGQAFGIIMTGRNLGVFTGPVLLAGILSVLGSWNAAGPIFGIITLAGAAGCILLVGSLRRNES